MGTILPQHHHVPAHAGGSQALALQHCVQCPAGVGVRQRERTCGIAADRLSGLTVLGRLPRHPLCVRVAGWRAPG